MSVYLYTFEDYSYVLSVNSQYGAVIILTIFSVVSLLIGCFGICAVYQLNTGMLTAFWVVLLVCIFGFAAGAAVGLATPILFQSYGCSGQVYPAIYSIANQTTLANLKFCVLNNCTCYINPAGNFNTTNITGLSSVTNITQPISVIQCVGWGAGIYDRSIASFESNFNCSGWCTRSNRYLFSDVNRGNPQSACFDSFSNWFTNFSKYVYVTCFIFTGLSIVLMIWICVFQRFCMSDDPDYAEVVEARSMMIWI